ncbi:MULTISPECIES: LysR family transcriptional regulator [unclassified Paenibacillus]|uniref:LysR family transcriptional regulator n=1 Tax=unclassified Paenibacillus TaxID=185978 RepID=UPI0009540B7A|nr:MULTISPECIES: LysR family transcriptional regulator [unclassified Paenibacillus]ASS67913.1 LysR family transcriptional regulator [Paenibacillus sp. RUD330]SIR44188.1 DNA-binding transcriptional regulator, LysR family [Paenibacillus sp. RU4X]SIR53990.1 DNA-binding transcriptional regulator, LysR family [Paenibacillus sp. RU4T]
MNIENIEAFVYVHHYGSFNKAAEALYLSQPSVTARIQTLERELDSRLFDRQAKQIALTEKGKQFLPYAQQILQTFRKGKLHIQQRRTLPGELRIGSTVSVSNYLIPDLLPLLQERFPRLTFKLTTGTSDELAAKLLDKELDLAFVRRLAHPSLQSFPLYEDPIKLYVHEDHPFAGRGVIPIEEIGSQKLIFFECGSLDWQRVHRVFESLEHPPDIVFQADNSETAKKLVMHRAGICFLPGICVRREVGEGRLIPVDVKEIAGISLHTSLIAPSGENIEIVEAIRGFRPLLEL